MVNKDILLSRLERLRAYLRILKIIQQKDIDQFISDPLIHGAAERYLHLAIESALDIGNHVISERGFRKPETYGEIFMILSQEGVVSPELYHRIEGMAAFRNVLVHDYLKLDHRKVLAILKEKLTDLEELADVYSRLL